MSTDFFYADLPILTTFVAVTEAQNFVAVPRDWWVSLDISFVFGGDEASISISPSLWGEAQRSLDAVQILAVQEFQLELRVGAVPVGDVIAAGYEINIAKLKVSEHYQQTMFIGGGLNYATDLVKQIETAKIYALNAEGITPNANFSGLECRWQDIYSPYGETISLLVIATQAQQYREVIETIEHIYGLDDRSNPVTPDRWHLAFSPQALSRETKVRTLGQTRWGKLLWAVKTWLENIWGWLLMKSRRKTKDVDWGAYPTIVAAATACRKFDDMLRMVIAGNTQQRQQLTDYLDQKYQIGQLTYGLHVSDRAVLTCLVFERNGRQVHFVDGADGGYSVFHLDEVQ